MMLIAALEDPGCNVLYITLTMKNAKRLLWKTLRRLHKQYSSWGLEMEYNKVELQIEISNGSTLILGGAQDEEEIEKYLGLNFPLVIIDEAQSIRESVLRKLINEVLEPAMLDKDGTLCLFGTPNAIATGYFFEKDQEPSGSWERFYWTLLDNVFLPHAGEWLLNRMRENQWTEQTPVYVRQYKGQWCRDENSLVYSTSHVQFSSGLPLYQGHYVLGVDLGFKDATAFSVWWYSEDCKEIYLVYSKKFRGYIADDVANHIKGLEREHGKFQRIVADCGGLGLMIVEELNKRYSLNIYKAEKTAKLSYIQLMNGEFQAGRIRVLDGEGTKTYLEEIALLEWDSNNLAKGRFIEHRERENHCADSALYAWRECRHYRYEEEVVPVKKERGASWMEAEILKQFERQEQGDGYDYYN